MNLLRPVPIYPIYLIYLGCLLKRTLSIHLRMLYWEEPMKKRKHKHAMEKINRETS